MSSPFYKPPDEEDDEGLGLMANDERLGYKPRKKEQPGIFDRLAAEVAEVYNSTLGAEQYGRPPKLAPGSKLVAGRNLAPPAPTGISGHSGKKKKPKKKIVAAAKKNADAAEQTAEQMAKEMARWQSNQQNVAAEAQRQEAGIALQNAARMERQVQNWSNRPEDDVMSYQSGFISLPEIEQFQPARQSFDILSTLKARQNNAPAYRSMGTGISATDQKAIDERTKKMFDAVTWWSKNNVREQAAGLKGP
jgi:hypothetical protein